MAETRGNSVAVGKAGRGGTFTELPFTVTKPAPAVSISSGRSTGMPRMARAKAPINLRPIDLLATIQETWRRVCSATTCSA
jgi:hypothetical protein